MLLERLLLVTDTSSNLSLRMTDGECSAPGGGNDKGIFNSNGGLGRFYFEGEASRTGRRRLRKRPSCLREVLRGSCERHVVGSGMERFFGEAKDSYAYSSDADQKVREGRRN